LKKISATYTVYLKSAESIQQYITILENHGFIVTYSKDEQPVLVCKIQKDKCIDMLYAEDIIVNNIKELEDYSPFYEYKDNWKKLIPITISSIITALAVYGTVSSLANISRTQSISITAIPTLATFFTQILYKFFPEDATM